MLLASWWQVLAFVTFLIVIKATLISVSAKIVSWSVPGSMQLGFLLAQGSEFVFVIVSMPAIRSELGEAFVCVLFSGVAISLALTPTVAELGSRLAKMARERLSLSVPKAEVTPLESLPPVVIFGMEKVGRTVADALEAFDIEHDAMERDFDIFTAASVDGYKVLFGDLGDYRLSETLAMSERGVIAITDVRFDVSEQLTPIVKERFPKLTRLVCVDDEEDGSRYERLGMESVIDDKDFPGEQMARRVLKTQRVESDRIDEWFERRRQRASAGNAV